MFPTWLCVLIGLWIVKDLLRSIHYHDNLRSWTPGDIWTIVTCPKLLGWYVADAFKHVFGETAAWVKGLAEDRIDLKAAKKALRRNDTVPWKSICR
jgi:hypothetical protein